MGKDQKGREIGKGLAQREDGRYSARFVDQAGRRKQMYFDTLQKARRWLEEAKYDDRHNSNTPPFDMVAFSILARLYDARKNRRESEDLDMQLEFKDRLSDEIRYLDMKNLVFINRRMGMPSKNSSYNTHLYKLYDEAGIKHIAMHALRHTFATRAIERGMHPKALQKLLGHASLQVTMDTYVHVTDSSKLLAIRQFEENEPEALKTAKME